MAVVNPMHPISIYSEKVMQIFKGCKQEDMPPHIYAMGQMTYREMLQSRSDQSIVFMGRSGSGKTSNSRHVMQYLITAAGSVGNIFTGLFISMKHYNNPNGQTVSIRTLLEIMFTWFRLLMLS